MRKPARIAITADDPEMIATLLKGFESREFIDLYGVKFVATKLTINPGLPEFATMHAEEIRMVTGLPWSGVGLPPAGTVCEAWFQGQNQGTVEVRYSGECMVLYSQDRKHEQCAASENYTFKPIRAEAELAAYRKKEAVDRMVKKINQTGSWAHIPTIEALYDAGLLNREEQ